MGWDGIGWDGIGSERQRRAEGRRQAARLPKQKCAAFRAWVGIEHQQAKRGARPQQRRLRARGEDDLPAAQCRAKHGGGADFVAARREGASGQAGCEAHKQPCQPCHYTGTQPCRRAQASRKPRQEASRSRVRQVAALPETASRKQQAGPAADNAGRRASIGRESRSELDTPAAAAALQRRWQWLLFAAHPEAACHRRRCSCGGNARDAQCAATRSDMSGARGRGGGGWEGAMQHVEALMAAAAGAVLPEKGKAKRSIS